MSDLRLKKRALIIGINYITIPRLRLNGCIEDSKLISEFWIKNGVSADNLLVLTDEDKKNQKKLPTASNVRKAFRWLLTDATVSDFFNTPESSWITTKVSHQYYLHYSGHGTQVRDLNGDEKDGRDEAICCLNDTCSSYSTIIDDELRSELAAKIPNGSLLFGTMDCCHSGTVIDLPYKYDGTSVEVSALELNRKVYVISGCQDNQTSADAYIGGLNVGATTAAFLSVMKDSGSSNYTYGQILEKMNIYRVQNVQHNQKHVFSYCNKGDESKKFLSM